MRKRRVLHLIFCYVLLIPFCFAQELNSSDRAGAVAAVKTITVAALRAHMRFLSDSLLEGRDTGSRGYDIGA